MCFVLKFALPPPLPSGMQISKQNMQSTFHTRIVQKSFSVIFPLPSPATPHGERNETLMHSRRRRCLYSTVSIYGGGEEIWVDAIKYLSLMPNSGFRLNPPALLSLLFQRAGVFRTVYFAIPAFPGTIIPSLRCPQLTATGKFAHNPRPEDLLQWMEKDHGLFV